MTEYDQKIWDAISSVLNGNPSDENKKLLDSWKKESEGNKKFFEIMVQQTTRNYDSSDELKERIYDKVKGVLPTRKLHRINYWIPAAAASVAIILSFIFFSLVTKPWSKPAMVYLEATTPFGVKTKLILPDSTLVHLNAGSYLRYPAIFNGDTRDIFLKGEAYFEVQKDKSHPFIVKTSAISVKVLGTHFNLKAFPSEGLYETTLLEGAVALYNNSSPEREIFRVKPNQKVSFFEKTGNIKVQNVNAVLEASWKDGKFYFDHETLASIVKNLERNFNVPVRICSDELNNEVFSGFFDKNRTIYQTLDIMKLHKNFYYLSKKDTILIYKK